MAHKPVLDLIIIVTFASIKEPTCGFTNDNRACNKYGTTNDITRAYNNETGYLASTTGNISGIYDMSGGSWEYIMGIMVDASGNPLSGNNASLNSGFNGGFSEGGSLSTGYFLPDTKYYDTYTYGTSDTEYTRGHFGDATFEMRPFKSIIYFQNVTKNVSSWYYDIVDIVNNIHPWVVGGGTYWHGTEAGQFAISHYNGSLKNNVSFRIVLTP